MAKIPQDEPYIFPGFAAPHYTQVPDDLFDVLMARLSEAELKVLLYVIRRTFGFKKDADAISLSQMVKGITTRDGRVLDTGTGMSKSSVWRGINGLLAKQVLLATKATTEDGDNDVTVYSLHFQSEVVSKSNHGGSKTKPPVVSKSNTQDSSPQKNEYQKYQTPGIYDMFGGDE